MIIAVIPAKGHEYLVAEGPSVDGCVPERPMLVLRCGCGVWACREGSGETGFGEHDTRYPTLCSDAALVLHAPGDPKLGMLRAMAAAAHALGVRQLDVYRYLSFEHAPISLPDEQRLALALAHLLVQRGPGAEGIVLPAEAKE